MPSQVRYIQKKVRSFDHFIEDLVSRGAFEVEHHYFGITDQARADEVRRGIRSAGRHVDPPVSVRSFWYECKGCKNGGDDCRFHVSYTIFDPEKARAFVAARQATARKAVGE